MKKTQAYIIIGLLTLSILLGQLIFDSKEAKSATVIGAGSISVDTIWDIANGTYYIEGNVTLDYGVNLTIEPGVEVRFNGPYWLHIGGNLTAVGTPANMINFTSNASFPLPGPLPGDWDRIQVNLTGHATIKYCNITYSTYGLEIIGSNENDIQNNNISSNYFDGITLFQSSNNTISNNTVIYNENNGIFLSESHENDIKYNNVYENWVIGIFLSKSSDNHIINNSIWGNYRGIYLSGSSGAESENNELSLNSIYMNDEGIRMISFTSNNHLIKNFIFSNTDYGMALSGSHNNNITKNDIFLNSDRGLYLSSANNNDIIKNNISTNAKGINLTSSVNNQIYHNIFWNNTEQAHDDTTNNFWDDGFPSGGNYWSDFDEPGEGAYDNNTGPNQDEVGSDGIVDDPYMAIGGGAGALDNYPLIIPSITRTFVYLNSPMNNSIVVQGTILDFIIIGDDIAYVNYSRNSGANTTLPSPWNISTTGWSDDIYIIDIFIHDSKGNVTSFWVNLTIDSTKPEIILNSPINGSIILPGVTINLTVSDTNLANASYTVNGGSNITFVAPFNIDTSIWGDGNHIIQVSAVDRAGNWNNTQYNFTIDGSGPIITLESHPNNAVIKPGTFLVFDIVDPHLNASTVNYSVNGTGPQPFAIPYEINTTTWPDGSYIIEVNATDTLGNANSSIFSIIIDSIPPSISLISPVNNSIITAGSILNFEIVDDNFDSATYARNMDPPEILIPPFDIDTLLWEDGIYEIYIYAFDQAGNSNSGFYNFTVATPPKIILNSPANNSTIKGGTIINLTILDTNIDIVNYSINGSLNQTLSPPYDIDTLNWTDGYYLIEVHAKDTANNTNSDLFNFTIDSTLPYIVLNSPSGNYVFIPGTILDFDIFDIHLISVSNSTEGGPYNAFFPPYDIGTTGWGEGNYSIIIIATDAAGNINFSEFFIILDSTLPVIELLSPVNGTSGEIGILINLSISDDNLDFVNYSVNSGPNQTLTSPFNIDTSSFPDGNVILTIYAVDLAGNINITWYEFIFNDTTAPYIILNSPQNQSVIIPGTIIDLEIFDLYLNNTTYSFDYGADIPFADPYNITTSGWSEGMHILIVYADDSRNNTNTSLLVFIIDSTNPSIALNSHQNNSLILPGEVLDFDIIEENLDMVNYSINSGAWQNLTSPFDFDTTGWADGIYDITILAVDKAGNRNTALFRIIIDSTPPSILLNSPGNNSFIMTGTLIDINATDANQFDVEYSINDGGTIDLASPFNIYTSGWEDGNYTIKIHANDSIGNAIDASFAFTLDSTSPEGQIVVSAPYYPFNFTRIIIYFTEPMNTESVEPVLRITPNLNYTVAWYDDDRTLTLLDIIGLQLNEFYTVDLEVGATDLAGNPLDNFTSYQFMSTIDFDLDTDEDGMPDGWELYYGLDPYDPADAQEDPDGDGYSNLEEFEGFSDPTDIDSIPLEPKEEPSALQYWWLIPILIALLIIAIVLFILLLEEKKEEPKGPVEQVEDIYLAMRAQRDIEAMESFLKKEEKLGDNVQEAEIMLRKAKEAFEKGDYAVITVYEKTLRDLVGEDVEGEEYIEEGEEFEEDEEEEEIEAREQEGGNDNIGGEGEEKVKDEE